MLRPGGRFAMDDQVAADEEPLHFQVPWARGSETSFLRSVKDIRRLLDEAGFSITVRQDAIAAAMA